MRNDPAAEAVRKLIADLLADRRRVAELLRDCRAVLRYGANMELRNRVLATIDAELARMEEP